MKEATCTEEGLDQYKCSACGDTYTKKTDALGHEMEETTVEPTCKEDGVISGDCSRCEEHVEEIIPALGHDLTVDEQPATCIEDGYYKSVCNRCGETTDEVISALGHDFPEEWIVEKAATKKEEGLEYHLCTRCNEREERSIAKLPDSLPLIITATVAAIGGIGAGLFFWLKKAKTATTGIRAIRLGDPDVSLSEKIVLFCLKNKTINTQTIEYFKNKRYVDTEILPYDEIEKLGDTAADGEPDLVLISCEDENELETLTAACKDVREKYEDAAIAVLAYKVNLEGKLEAMKEEGVIDNYVFEHHTDNEKNIKLLLPLYKPSMDFDSSLSTIATVCDIFSIPYVSTIVGAYESGKDIVETVQAGELGISEDATIVGDIADILGLDTVSSVAGLVGDLDTIKESRLKNEDAGVYENAEAINAGKDIVDVVTDVVKDIIDK